MNCAEEISELDINVDIMQVFLMAGICLCVLEMITESKEDVDVVKSGWKMMSM